MCEHKMSVCLLAVNSNLTTAQIVKNYRHFELQNRLISNATELCAIYFFYTTVVLVLSKTQLGL